MTDCNFESDMIDRRIVYEMIGEKLEPCELMDETSESEEELDDSSKKKVYIDFSVNDIATSSYLLETQ